MRNFFGRTLSESTLNELDEPIRAEIFGVARLEDHAKSLAHEQTVTDDPRSGREVSARVRENQRVLVFAYHKMLQAVKDKRAITTAAEWLIDNFHIVRSQLKDIHEHLPPAYYRELPKIAKGPLAGYPRVYGIAWAFVAHTDSRFDPELLKTFLAAYQRVQPLTIGELWAVPITLRLVLIENLRRLAARIVNSQEARLKADKMADSLLGVGEEPHTDCDKVIETLERQQITKSFAVQLLQRLRFQEARIGLLFQYVDQRLAKDGCFIEEWVASEHTAQSTANITVRNIITSARSMSAYHWPDFFEQSSLVDHILRESSDFGLMDFTSRDRYRHRIEELARKSPHSEIEVAKRVIERSAQQPEHLGPGYFLIGDGRFDFEDSIGFSPDVRTRFLRWYKRNGTVLFLGSILLITGLTSLAALVPTFQYSDLTPLSILTSILAVIIGSEVAVAVVNRWTVTLLGPRHLPRLNFEKGIPDQHRTFVVVPTMLTDETKIRAQLEQIEIHYLSNQDDNVYLALLTDFADAKFENTDDDELLMDVAYSELKLLNERHPVKPTEHPRFSIYHRRRVFNPQEERWMGWERKRGKLHELNRLLLGATDTTYQGSDGNGLSVPKGIRYIVTLDADTKLPRGTVAQLVGTMAHPLNHAKFNAAEERVVAGYGILQPRITPSLPTRQENTLYRKLSTVHSGIDPYASAVSDVYQDLFAEGSFTGKGIYDLVAFEKALKSRIPENSVLSHDLLEGNFARCGFLSDVEFFEDFPTHTGVASLRNHRWIRGDWQLLPWIFGRRGWAISTMGRWKMLDNLRRSLVAPAGITLFFVSLIFYSARPLPLLALLFASLFVSTFISFCSDLFSKRRTVSTAQHLAYTSQEFRTGLAQVLMSIVLLPHTAWNSMDAIVRVLYRMLISRKRLLEWTTAAQAKASASYDLKGFARSMRGSLILTTSGLILILVTRPDYFEFALPAVALWLASPLLARNFSRPPKARVIKPMKPEDIVLFHSTARRIWHFFSTFVTEAENFLPPDNFQEVPVPVVAHRSSPTNFGLYLISVLSARDFGWIGTCEAINRIEDTLKSLIRLERHQGHFYNWYDTSNTRPLEPRYISSVDNGNLTGHLVALAQGCEEILKSRIEVSGFNRGIFDTVMILDQELKNYKAAHTTPDETFLRVFDAYSELVARLVTPDHLIDNRTHHFTQLRIQLSLLMKHARQFVGDPISIHKEEIWIWCQALQNDIQSFSADFSALASWVDFANEKLPANSSPESRHRWEGIRLMLGERVALAKMPHFSSRLLSDILDFKKNEKLARRELPGFVDSLVDSLEHSIEHANLLVQKIQYAQSICRQLIREMDFRLLYDNDRQLFSIGMRASENQLDPSYYDLLASEARLTSFIAIAKGDIPVSHWFHLGRSLVKTSGGTTLVSWSGSMFEYLMPCIVMNSPESSLLEESCRSAIARQIEYGHEKNVPWGFSESAYNRRDLRLTYQYSNFGVPDLGLKRGLDADTVVSPYSTIMAAMFEPALAAANLRRLQKLGAEGRYGFFEAVDFTSSRLPEGQTSSIVKAYMAHHQGMALVALANVFRDSAMQRRFHADPTVQATELLLQERTPHSVGTLPTVEDNIEAEVVREPVEHISRQYHSVNRPIPTTHLLSNGNYTVMLTSAGSGFSRVRDLAVTRWREDITCDNSGYFIYLKDCDSNQVWSAGHQPICTEADHFEVSFAEDRARFVRQDFEITSELEVFVSPEENAEIRRLTLTNNSPNVREIEVTSYLEVVLNTQGADKAHPAFSNLFIETEFNPDLSALFASRRPRSKKEKRIWMMHILRGDRHTIGPLQHETDRARFIGRGRNVMNPAAIFENEKLSGTVGPVLDPILSLRARVRLEPGVATHLTFSCGVSEDREAIEIMADKFNEPSIFERASDLAWTQAQVKLHYLGVEPDEAHLYQRLTTRLLYSDPSLRPPSEILKKNFRDVTALWAYGISGDHPIVLVRIDEIDDRNLIRQLLRAQIYLATKSFVCDLVVLNDKASSYSQELQIILEQMAQAAHTPSELTLTRGQVFVLRSELIPEADQILLSAEARVILSTRHGSLSDQVKRTLMHQLPSPNTPSLKDRNPVSVPLPKLEFFNGYGGFSDDGEEYTIALKNAETTPAPWINVIANQNFGFQVSECGSGYTWAGNSRENQLTPWSNDPVADPSGEAFFIRDRDSGMVWSPTAAPIRIPEGVYLAHHGPGYSRFELSVFEIYSELKQFVEVDQPVKVSCLSLENKSNTIRRLSITGYVEWVLGFSRSTMAPTTLTEFDQDSQAVFAWNPRNTEHGKRIAFNALLSGHTSYTCDRTEFIGRNSNLSQPLALFIDEPLKKRTGGGLDPCTALNTDVELKPGRKIELHFVLGQVADVAAARETLARLRKASIDEAFTRVTEMWQGLLGQIQVETPDRSFDLMINRWYLYQTIACRLWARAAFYQVGGAYGFRDQLQDVMALMGTSPHLAREQILRAAARQFIEGDVQHWWHPPVGRGVRTRFSDDLLWLPYVVSQYLKVTQDKSLLNEHVGFIEGPPLEPGQEDSYYTPNESSQTASVFEHCTRALEHSLKTGVHGLPLMGAGDWNDGMNHVGIDGQGESVWLAWFLHVNLQEFSAIARQRGELELATKWSNHAQQLIQSVEKNAWDGEWYRRAYFDDGTPLGSKTNTECKIDSLAQTWSVISGAAQPDRAMKAMSSVFEHLVLSNDQMILLFTPPFDKTDRDPGYIKGYLPGVRENGGQYTHAASWVVIASALLGNGKKAFELFSHLNPIHHTRDLSDVHRYKAEPYVLAGDVYSQEPHLGRGGWSWYTGAAGWMHRAGLEYILGFQVRGNELVLKPCVPPEWKHFRIRYKYGTSLYTIHFDIEENVEPKTEIVKLIDDGKPHEVSYPNRQDGLAPIKIQKE